MAEPENGLVPFVVTATEDRGWKYHVVTAARQLVVAVATAAVIVGGLVIAFSSQTAEEVRRQEVTIQANLAIACVLALPSDPEHGRKPAQVKQCFTQYDLRPPILGP